MEIGKIVNSGTLANIIEHPSGIKTLELQELQEVMNTFPYFAVGQLLLTKKMQQLEHLQLKQNIKKAAVLIHDRKKVYEFLYQEAIQESILESQEDVEKAPIKEELPTVAEVNPEEAKAAPLVEEIEEELPVEISDFETPVEIPSQTEQKSTFAKPINLREFGNTKNEELDFLEKQIIGQTIEHVLTQEIATQFDATHPPTNIPEEKPFPKTSQKFSDWLEILDHNRLSANRKKEDHKLSESDIIDTFLNSGNKVISTPSSDVEFTPSNLARLSVVDDEEFVTETLANIYAKQGNITKAIKTYQKLMLKFPEKKTYFAGRIKKLEIELK